MNAESSTAKTPIHLWIVGVLSLLWNAMGAWDYYATQTKNPAYLEQFTPELLAWFDSIPAWAVATWALAVWGGLLGSILLLLRKRLAVPVFLVSMVCMILTAIQNYVLSNGLEMIGDTFSLVFTLVIFVVTIVLWVYARKMAEKGVLH